jgi:pyruvate,water dikinase
MSAAIPLVCPLARADRVAGCGGKAANLARALRLGLPVPAGVVITDRAFREFLGANGLAAAAESPPAGGAAAEALRARVVAATIPPPLWDELTAALAGLPPGERLAVRSSAVGEDSAHASFAGQLDSILGIDRDKGLESALLACWASYWSGRALAYQSSRGTRLRGMGVIVQRLVRARFAGVLFTRGPGATEDETLLAEYCHGLGDALVSGRVNPGRVVLSRAGGCLEMTPPETGDGGPDGDRLAELARVGRALEEALGAPQDVEWAVGEDNQLYVLQSRPITAAHGAGARRVVWSNANVSENYPEPISPLLYSVASAGYYHYFRNLALAFGFARERVRAMERPLRHVIGVHGARMYYNLTNIHAVLRQAPLGEALAGFFNSFVGAAQTPRVSPHGGAARRGPLARAAELCRVAAKTTWQFLFLPQRVAAFERTADEFAARTDPADLDRRDLLDLLDDLRVFLDIRCHRWKDASLADAASMVTYGALKRLIAREFPSDDCPALHNNLLKGLADVISSVPIARLWDLSRRVRHDDTLATLFASCDGEELLTRLRQRPEFAAVRAEFEDYLRQWGFRRSGELMLTVPSFQERPAELLDILKVYAARDGDSPAEQMERQGAARATETARVLSELRRRKLARFLPWPTKATLARVLMRWARRSIALRERARLKQALLYNRLRRIALAIGGRLTARRGLETADDIFFLTYQEIDDLLSGSAMFPEQVKELVRLRRAGHAALSAAKPPDGIELGEGAYLPPSIASTPADGPTDGEPILSGVSACGGRVTGRAAVLRDVSEFGLLAAGDVLVTRQTDPGWGPVFPLIRGLVIERGGMLSHGAIIAREFGIPAVVGVRDATRRIATGQTLTVDGDRGLVHLVG